VDILLSTLHAVWQPKYIDTDQPGLLFWAEIALEDVTNRRLQEHPLARSSSSLTALLGTALTGSAFSFERVPLLLPTHNNMPVHSSIANAPANLILREWPTPCIKISGGRIINAVMELEQHVHRGHVHLAPDLLFWLHLIRWTWSMMEQGRIIPELDTHAATTFVPRIHWSPKYSFAVQQDLDRFAVAMPTACMAAQLVAKDILPTVDEKYEVVSSFVDWLVGVSADEWISKSTQHRLDRHRTPRPNHNWDLVLQLSPIADDPVASGSVSLAENWQGSYWLRDRSDISITVSASSIWDDDNSNTKHLRTTLLEMLCRYAAKVAPIRASLHEARPSSCLFSRAHMDELLSFKEPHAWPIGLVLQLPSWFKQPQSITSVRLWVDSSKSGHFSLTELRDFRWQVAIGDALLDSHVFYQLAHAKLPAVQIHGQWITLDPQRIKEILTRWDIQNKISAAGLITAIGNATALDNIDIEIEAPHATAAEMDFWQILTGKWDFTELDSPDHLKVDLRPYQLRGFSWLALLRNLGLGACLADDMGLGKTLQVIALLQQIKNTKQATGPHLVICPTSVLEVWRKEIKRFAPTLSVMVHHGNNREKDDRFTATCLQFDVVVTSYNLALRDAACLANVSWDTIVLDEAQHIKNHATKQARSIKGLSAYHRIALTGTPVENSLVELWSIMDFLNHGLLDNITAFKKRFVTSIEQNGDAVRLTELQQLIRPFVLRRTKEDPSIIPELPDKTERLVPCRLTVEQVALYQATTDHMLQLVQDAEGIKRRGLVLATLTRLKQICDHPALYLKDTNADPNRSGKMLQLLDLLSAAHRSGQKTLIFTQYSQMGRLLKLMLAREGYGNTFFLHGGVPRSERDHMVDSFQTRDNESIFILSLKSGGTGLTLTRATQVVHFDRWWNPAVENQATDRAYRIGQDADVTVHKFSCLGTLEERVNALLEEKQALAQNVLDAGDRWLTELGLDELAQLITLQTEGA
jgi:superfamily II DNA or RNA helicase